MIKQSRVKHPYFNSLTTGIAASAILISRSFLFMQKMKRLEKEELKFGFITLADMGPLVLVYKKAGFEDEGLFSLVAHSRCGEPVPCT